jgi:hypothetical protein
MLNYWYKLKIARDIAEEMLFVFRGCASEKEDEMIQYLWDHKLYDGEMFLNVIWDDNNLCNQIQIGTMKHLVPYIN